MRRDMCINEVIETIQQRGYKCVKLHCHAGDYRAMCYNPGTSVCVQVEGADSVSGALMDLLEKTAEARNELN